MIFDKYLYDQLEARVRILESKGELTADNLLNEISDFYEIKKRHTICPVCNTNLDKVDWEKLEELNELQPLSVEELASLRKGQFGKGN